MRYENNINTPTEDLVIDSLIELGPSVSSIIVRKLLFSQPPPPLQGLVFENRTRLEIRAQAIAADGILRWKFANQAVLLKPPMPGSPPPQPAAPNGNNNSREGKPGAAGIPGAIGTSGAAGESGPTVQITCESIVGYLALDVRGTKGQSGGDGGSGGQGGNGGRGDQGDSTMFDCKRGGWFGGNAGAGGPGGDGGNGGVGGAGGNISINFSGNYALDLDPIVDGGEGGVPGTPGVGGPAGAAGPGGEGDGWCDDMSEARRGAAAAAGETGSPGRFLGRGKAGALTVAKINQSVDQLNVDAAHLEAPGLTTQNRRSRVRISFGIVGAMLLYAAVTGFAEDKAPGNKPTPPPSQNQDIANIIGEGRTIKPEDFKAVQRYIPSSSRVSVDGLPVRLGQGYNSLSGQFRGFGVSDHDQGIVFPAAGAIKTDENPASPSGALANDGQSLSYTFQYIENATELRKTLDINASASLNLGLFSASAKVSLFTQHQENANSSYLLIRAKVVNAVQRLNDYVLTTPAINAAKDSQQFIRSFGDQFVTGIITGGELTGVVELQFQSSSDKEKFDASLKASYGMFGSLSVSVKQAVDKSTHNLRVSASLLRVGGIARATLITYKPDTFDIIWQQIDKNMADLSQAFIEDVKAHPAVLEVTTLDYNVCSNAGTTSFPTLSFAKWYYNVMAATMEELRSVIQGNTDTSAMTVAETLPAKRLRALRFLADPILFDVSAENLYSYRDESPRLAQALGIVAADPTTPNHSTEQDRKGIGQFINSASPSELLSLTEAEVRKLRKSPPPSK